ncbi:hypothetical protein BH11BAC2_BH11BAC2_02880 [soil metagenome]
MRIVFLLVFIIHAIIHSLGFMKAFRFAEVKQLSLDISKPQGVFWLIATLLFIMTGVFSFLRFDKWWMVSLLAIFISQSLIFMRWSDAKYGTIINIVLLGVTIVGAATWKYHNVYLSDVKNELSYTSKIEESILNDGDLQGLPLLIQKYIILNRAVGKPKVRNFKIIFEGKIRKNEKSEWMPFVSEQFNFMERSTRLFFMNASMKNLPVAGYHAFKNGTAMMDIRLLSLFKVQYQTGKEMGISETVTFFNDMCCLAPATLIDPRIKWTLIDENKVKAVFTNNQIAISALLYFNSKGELVNFVSEDRYAIVDGTSIKRFPWSTPLSNYKVIHNRYLPGFAETIYTYPEGNFTYGTFKILDVTYNY